MSLLNKISTALRLIEGNKPLPYRYRRILESEGDSDQYYDDLVANSYFGDTDRYDAPEQGKYYDDLVPDSVFDRPAKSIAKPEQQPNPESNWKDPNNSNYDRQVAENGLFHTIGPMLENPRWTQEWTSPGKPIPGFKPGGPAPRWTQEEIVYAFAGDPNLLWKSSDNPRSPSYGNKGGAPLLRAARRVARTYNKSKDKSFIDDMYSNGFVALLRMMQPGFDEGRSPFISYVIRNVTSAMQHGVGGEVRTTAAAGLNADLVIGKSKVAVRGLRSLLDETDPEKLQKAASVVKGDYRTTQSHDKNVDNPFGYFSAPYYQTVMRYANALETRNSIEINDARSQIHELIQRIEKYSTLIGGASTGLGQAIDTKDRKTSIGIVSADQPVGDDDGATIGSMLTGDEPEDDDVDQEAIYNILDIALNQNLGSILANSEKYRAMAKELGAKDGKIGAAMPVNEFRYMIRSLGRFASNYPGKGNPRANLSIPRDSKNWWVPGEDPEIEPLKIQSESSDPISNGMWRSIWIRTGYQGMGPTAISAEMSQELEEFQRYGIASGRSFTVKKDKYGNEIKQAVHKQAVTQALKTAMIKFKILADIYQLGVNEGITDPTLNRMLSLDDVDRGIMIESLQVVISRLEKAITSDKPATKHFLVTNSITKRMRPITSFL
jgi:hypothetical protein